LWHRIDRHRATGNRYTELVPAYLTHCECQRFRIQDGADTFRGLDFGDRPAVQFENPLAASQASLPGRAVDEHARQPEVIISDRQPAESETAEPAFAEKLLVGLRRIDEAEPVYRLPIDVGGTEGRQMIQHVTGCGELADIDTGGQAIIPEVPVAHRIHDELFLPVARARRDRPPAAVVGRTGTDRESGEKQEDCAHDQDGPAK
jgi:hypothetical protein